MVDRGTEAVNWSAVQSEGSAASPLVDQLAAMRQVPCTASDAHHAVVVGADQFHPAAVDRCSAVSARLAGNGPTQRRDVHLEQDAPGPSGPRTLQPPAPVRWSLDGPARADTRWSHLEDHAPERLAHEGQLDKSSLSPVMEASFPASPSSPPARVQVAFGQPLTPMATPLRGRLGTSAPAPVPPSVVRVPGTQSAMLCGGRSPCKAQVHRRPGSSSMVVSRVWGTE